MVVQVVCGKHEEDSVFIPENALDYGVEERNLQVHKDEKCVDTKSYLAKFCKVRQLNDVFELGVKIRFNMIRGTGW